MLLGLGVVVGDIMRRVCVFVKDGRQLGLEGLGFI